MKILALRLVNVGSYQGEHFYTLPQVPGLYHLTGDNQVEPELGTNAVGKSWLWDALFWGLFGTTARGVRAGGVCAWAANKGVAVEVFMEDDGVLFSILREWGPNGLFICHGEEKSPTTQEYLDDTLGVHSEQFLHSVFLSQKRTHFLDLLPSAKADLFASAVGADKWAEYSKKAAAKSSELSAEIVAEQNTISRLRGNIESMDVSFLAEKSKEWVSEQIRIIQDNDRIRKQLELDSEKSKIILAQNKNDLADCRTVWAWYECEREGYMAELCELDNNYDSYIKHKEEADRACAKAEKALESMCNDTCPMCNQTIPPNHLQAERVRLEYEAARSAMNSASIGKKLREVRVRMSRAAKCAELCDAEIYSCRERMRRLERTVELNLSDLRTIESSIKSRWSLRERLEEQENPYDLPMQRALEDLKAKQEQLSEKEKTLERLQKARDLNAYWIRGFKEVRLFVIQEALRHLEAETNASLESLGLVGWSLHFDIDKETQSGTSQRSFTTEVKSPHTDKRVPWEAWSGGEAQRLRLAANMGLSQLINSSLGVDLGIEIWDEATTGMGDRGISGFLEVLRSRAEELGRVIWVIDHHSITFGGFTQTFTVVKTEKGSVLAG